MQTEVLVISLRHASARRTHIAAQFDALDIPFSFFDAVDGRQGHPLFARYNARKRLREETRDMSAGQLGCYASHYLVWAHCMRCNHPVVVLEDDARIEPERFRQFLAVTPDIPPAFECVRLFPPLNKRNRPSIEAFRRGDLGIFKFRRGHKSATGYYLTPAGAAKLLQHSREWVQPVDIEMDRFWLNKVEAFGLHPPCLENDADFESMIGYDIARAPRPIRVTIFRKINQARDDILRQRHNLEYFLRRAASPEGRP